MSMRAKLEVGQQVTFVDPVGKPRPAIVTAVWEDMCGAGVDGCNVVFISDDESKTDPYGRQIERETSVSHESAMNVHGRFWR